MSDLGGLYIEGYQQTTATDTNTTNNLDTDTAEPQGLQHFDEGKISEAILCFELILRNIDPEHAHAWRMLGKCHTKNDEDQRDIVCW